MGSSRRWGSGRWTNREAGRDAARRTPAARPERAVSSTTAAPPAARPDAPQGAALEVRPPARGTRARRFAEAGQRSELTSVLQLTELPGPPVRPPAGDWLVVNQVLPSVYAKMTDRPYVAVALHVGLLAGVVGLLAAGHVRLPANITKPDVPEMCASARRPAPPKPLTGRYPISGLATTMPTIVAGLYSEVSYPPVWCGSHAPRRTQTPSYSLGYMFVACPSFLNHRDMNRCTALGRVTSLPAISCARLGKKWANRGPTGSCIPSFAGIRSRRRFR